MKKIIVLINLIFLNQFSLFSQEDKLALDLLNSMSDNYKKMKGFTSSFTYSMKNLTEDITDSFSGKISVKDDKYVLFIEGQKIINDSNNKPDKVIRTHRREMIIIPQFVGRKFGVYNGREFVDLEILPEMIGLYFGELAPTRTSPTHTGPGVGATKSSKFMPLK